MQEDNSGTKDPQMSETTQERANVFRTKFGHPNNDDEQKEEIQSQVVELLRQEATTGNANVHCDKAIVELKEQIPEAHIDKVKKINEKNTQVQGNKNSLDQHDWAI